MPLSLHRLLYRLVSGSWGAVTFQKGGFGPETAPIPDPAGLYVHIPFCRTICPFCPYTKMSYDPLVASRYSAAVEKEVLGILSSLGTSSVSGIYFGGGTPLTMPDTVRRLIDLVRPRLVPDAHVAIEMHPKDVLLGAWEGLRDAGVNMLSLGIQSMHDSTLRHLGRDHDSTQARAALLSLMDDGSCSVSVDLMTGIPGQSMAEAVLDMRELVGMGVDQIAAYPLMDFTFTRGRTNLSFLGQRRLLDALASAGEKGGYDRSSVWTWTRPGSAKYTSITRANYLGAGVGAASNADQYFWLNTFSVEDYIRKIEKGSSPACLGAHLRPSEAAMFRLFWRCYEGEFDLDGPEARDISCLPTLTRVGESLGLLALKGTKVKLTRRGFLVYQVLERYYTREYIGRLWRACRETPFPDALTL